MTAATRPQPLPRSGDADLDARTEAYLDVQGELHRTAARFAATHGRDVRDCIAEADVLFLDAYDSYNPDRGSFERWVVYRTRKKMLNALQVQANRRRLDRQVWAAGRHRGRKALAAGGRVFSLVTFTDGMSAAAAAAVRVVLALPPDTRGEDAAAARDRAAVRRELRKMGWTDAEVTAAFREISNTLGD